jgi:transposase
VSPLSRCGSRPRPGEQAQVDLARFEVEFTDEPGVTRIVWLFSMVLGYSRLIWARFIIHQDLQSVLRATLPRSRRLAAYRARFSTTA